MEKGGELSNSLFETLTKLSELVEEVKHEFCENGLIDLSEQIFAEQLKENTDFVEIKPKTLLP